VVVGFDQVVVGWDQMAVGFDQVVVVDLNFYLNNYL
jgi:hypothetical protein